MTQQLKITQPFNLATMPRQLAINQPFNLALTLTMGQAFRWRPLGDGWFSGVIGENLIHVRQTEDGIEYRVGGPDGERPATRKDDQLLRRYFREDDDVAAIYASIAHDPKVDTIVQEFLGLRITRQVPWECLAFQLCAADNDVERTGWAIETIAEFLGKKLELDGDVRHAFPTIENLKEDDRRSYILLKWQLGSKRTWNILHSSKRIEKGVMDWGELHRQPYPKVKEDLLLFPGVNDEIADRIALFALDKLDAFPMDLWVWRAITEAYPEWGFAEKEKLSGKNYRKASDQARRVFGKYAGYANQYLFYWRRRLGEEPLTFAHRLHGKFRLPPGMTADDARYEYLAEKYLS